MNDKELYHQKIQAELDASKAQIDKFKAEASGASADLQIEMHKQIKQLEEKMNEGKVKLKNLADASEDKFESMKKEVESTWQSIKSTLHHASKHFGK